MNCRRLICCAAALIVSAAAPLSLAQPACETTYIGVSGGDWDFDGNWDNNEPTSTLVACIPDDKVVVIPDGYDAEAEAVVIERDGTNAGVVYIELRGTLKLHDDSFVDGSIKIEFGAKLIAGNTLTIEGNGGEILGVAAFHADPPKIVDDGGSEVLTVTGFANDDRATSLVLHGAELAIDVALVNTAYVVADDGNLYLQTNGKSGSGFWIAENGADLRVLIEVSGSGKWEMVDNSSSGNLIQINAACTNLSGDVELSRGEFRVLENFETTGNLIARSEGATPTQVDIEVSINDSAKFGT